MAADLVERLANQQLARPRLRDPGEVVAWFGAIQAQDYLGAKWAIGLRAKTLTDADVEGAFNDGRILRTHVLRPTWHFVNAADIRWLMALSGPRVIARMAYRHRQLELDALMVSRSARALIRALEERPRTRLEIASVLRRAEAQVTAERLMHLIMIAELEGIVCSGPLRDRQFTYALMDDRVPRAAPIARDEALGRLAERYFRSHGPATLADFSWWSGLPVREARRAVEIAGTAIRGSDGAAGGTYRYVRRQSSARRGATAWLLPNFDEYLVAYRDRSAVLGTRAIDPRNVLTHTIVIDGVAAGTWRPRRRTDSISVDLAPWGRLPGDAFDCVMAAARRYEAFIGRSVSVAIPHPR